jgi:preprotein translocase subunit YajC
METSLQKGQKVLTPDGGGLIDEIIGEDVTVKLDTGATKTYNQEDVTDDSDQG